MRFSFTYSHIIVLLALGCWKVLVELQQWQRKVIQDKDCEPCGYNGEATGKFNGLIGKSLSLFIGHRK